MYITIIKVWEYDSAHCAVLDTTLGWTLVSSTNACHTDINAISELLELSAHNTNPYHLFATGTTGTSPETTTVPSTTTLPVETTTSPEVSTSTQGPTTVSVSTTSPTVTEVTTTKGSTTGTFVLWQ